MKKMLKIMLNAFFPGRFVLSRIKTNNREIALTFDDGPHPDNTPRLLQILREAAAKATFFVSGTNLEAYPALLKTVVEEGHEIGNHSFSHKKIAQLNPIGYWQEIEKASKLIQQYAPSDSMPYLFRPPYGELNLDIIRLILKHNLTYAGWTIDSKDSYIKSKNRLADFINATPVRPGDILLFHEDYPDTIEAMLEIIKDLRSRGFRLVTMSKLLDNKQ